MAALSPLQQEIFDLKNGRHLVVTLVNVTNSSDTLALPEGLGSTSHVAVLVTDTSNTVKSVSSISQGVHPAGVTVTLTGGTNGSDQFVISLHNGNSAGL